MAVEIANESGREVDEVLLAELARFVMGETGVHPMAELSVLLVDVEHMTRLHVEHMGEAGPTDVLAFEQDDLHAVTTPRDTELESPALLGDVVLCPEVAESQGAAAGHGTEAELHLLCTHGVLHLLGYDHHEPDEEAEMFGEQARLLQAWAAHRRTR